MPRTAPPPIPKEDQVNPKRQSDDPTEDAQDVTEAIGHLDHASNLRAAIELMDDDFKSQNLFVKIARISGFLGAVPKRGYNAFHKYHYVTEGDLVGAVRMYLAAAGIVMIPNVVARDQVGELTTLDIEYRVTDGSESFSFVIPGAGSDRGDKGVYKALTGSQKYAIMKLFKIETGDDPEADTRVDERAAQQDGRQERPAVRSGQRGTVRRGGHTTTTSPVQLRRISEQVKLLDWSRQDLIDAVALKFETDRPVIDGMDDQQQSATVVTLLTGLTTEQAGDLIADLSDRITSLEERVLDEAGGYA